MFFKINILYYHLKNSKKKTYKNFKKIKIVSSLIKEINVNVINNKKLLNSITFNNNKLLYTSLVLYLQNIHFSNKFNFFLTKSFLNKKKIYIFKGESYFKFINSCLKNRRLSGLHFKKNLMFKKTINSNYQLFSSINNKKDSNFLNIKKSYNKKKKLNSTFTKNKKHNQEISSIKNYFFFHMLNIGKKFKKNNNLSLYYLITFIYSNKGFSNFYSSLFFNSSLTELSNSQILNSFKVLFNIYSFYSALLLKNKKKKKFLRFYYFLLQYLLFFDNFLKHFFISNNVTYSSYFISLINLFRLKYKLKKFIFRRRYKLKKLLLNKLLDKTLYLHRCLNNLFKINYFTYKISYILDIHNSKYIGNIELLNSLKSYTSYNLQFFFDSFRVLFTKPLELNIYKFLNSNFYNNSLNFRILKFNNSFFSRIVIKSYSFYKTINKILKTFSFNPFYINKDKYSFYYYFSSLYKRHLINKFKFRKYKLIFKDNISFYSPVILNNRKFFKERSLKNFRLYKKNYLRHFFRPTLVNKTIFFNFNSYYDYQVIKDSFYKFDEYNIRYNFKYVYIYFFFRLFKKNIYFHAFSNIFSLYFNLKKERLLLRKKLTLFLNLDSIGIITYKYKVRNLFITLSDSKGNTLLKVSSGILGHFGYKKVHFPVIRSVIRTFLQRVLKKLFLNNITRLKFVIKGHYFNFYNLILPFVRRLTSYDKLTLYFINFLSFLRRYLLYLKREITYKKSNFFISFDDYFTIINRIKHLIDYISIRNKNTYIYRYYNYQVLFIQIKGFNNSFIK